MRVRIRRSFERVLSSCSRRVWGDGAMEEVLSRGLCYRVFVCFLLGSVTVARKDKARRCLEVFNVCLDLWFVPLGGY